jgi:signal recognition particle subunit SRP54
MQKGKFDLNDLAEQIRQMQKLGGMGGLMGMMPGMGKMKKQLDGRHGRQDRFTRQLAIISSMTRRSAQPRHPEASRKKRIAAGGCGADPARCRCMMTST